MRHCLLDIKQLSSSRHCVLNRRTGSSTRCGLRESDKLRSGVTEFRAIVCMIGRLLNAHLHAQAPDRHACLHPVLCKRRSQHLGLPTVLRMLTLRA